MTLVARISFNGAHHYIPVDHVDSVIEKLVSVAKHGGSSVISIPEDGGTSTLVWTPGAPITVETYEVDDD